MRKNTASLLFVLLLVSGCIPLTGSPALTPTPDLRKATATTPSSTSLPTPTQTIREAIFPYTIDGLRQHDFRSGDVLVREKLMETNVFVRYLIEYPSDGLTITGVMQIPKEGRSPFPVIIMNHGYFYRGFFASGDGTDRAAEYLNRHGYLTISSDYRSWGGSDIGPSLFYSGLVIDVINLLNAVPSIPQADPHRIGIWGHSMGGGVTVKTLTIENEREIQKGQQPTHIKAAVLYSTVSADDADLIARWGAGCIGDVHENELLYGCNSSDVLPLDLPADLLSAYQQASYDPAFLRKTSAINHLDYVLVPVQIGYGTEDGLTLNGAPTEWSRKLFEALKMAGVPAELFAYDDEGHSFVGNEWVAFMERSAHFFDKYVKNVQ